MFSEELNNLEFLLVTYSLAITKYSNFKYTALCGFIGKIFFF